MRAWMHDEKRHVELRRELNLLNERLHRLVAIVARLRAEVDEIADMTEDGAELLCSQFVGVEREIVGRVRFSKPLHVVLHKKLNNIAADFSPALQRLPNAAAGRHV